MPKKSKSATKKNTTNKKNTTKKINIVSILDNQGVKNATWGNIVMADERGLKGAERKKFLEEGVGYEKKAKTFRNARNKKEANRKQAAKNAYELSKISPVYPPWHTPPSSPTRKNNKKNNKKNNNRTLNVRKHAAAEKKAAIHVKQGELQKIAKQCKWHCKGHTCWAHTEGTCPYLHKKKNGSWEVSSSSARPPRHPRTRRNNTRKNY